MDLEKTQELKLSEAERKILEWSGIPYRVTPEVVIRTLLAQVDKVEDVAVIFRLRDKSGLLMNYSTEITATDLLVASATLGQLAYQKMGIVVPFQLPLTDMQPPNPEKPA